jgi:CheY-like chemotaxis protein
MLVCAKPSCCCSSAGGPSAASAAAARALLEHEPDVIVCDIAMPGEDGYSFVRSLRASGSSVPAIALTAHAMEVDAARAIDAGFNIHLAKPVSLDRLLSAIGKFIADPSAQHDQIT